jgi:hypothetical protein
MATSITNDLLRTEGASFIKTTRSKKSMTKGKASKSRYCQKTRYRYHDSAVRALTKARFQRQRALADGVEPMRTEARIYWHDQCNSYHLTSQPLNQTQAVAYAA